MKHYANKKVLVTGGTGFIGSRLTEKLSFEEDANVTVLVHDWKKSIWVSRTNAKLVQGDITKFSDVDRLVKGQEIVFHCVGIGGNVNTCRTINVQGTKNVLNACKKHNVERIVYLSTVGVHGPHIVEGLNEDSPLRSLGHPYADSKIEAENLFCEELHHSDVEGVVIRPTYVWGPNSMWLTIEPVNQLLGGHFFLVDEGRGACNALYVDNLIELILIAGWHRNAVGQTFLMTDGERLTWRQFFAHYARILNVDIQKVPSVRSSGMARELLLRSIKTRINQANNGLTRVIDRRKNHPSLFIRLTLKTMRFNLRNINRLLYHFFHQPYEPWDLMKFSSPGFISIHKAQELLSFAPRISVDQGMENCAIWLKDQHFVQA